MLEFMKNFVIAGSFGIILGLDICGIAYWISLIVKWVKKRGRETEE